MTLKTALEALKRRDFTAVRSLLATNDFKTFTIQHFQIKGIAELQQSDWEHARTTFTAATVKFPAYAAFWMNRAIAEENLGMYDEAIANNEKCLTINPVQFEALGNLSNLYRRKKRYGEAEAMARKALESGMPKGEGYNILSLALIKQGKIEEADEALSRAMIENPRNSQVIANRANVKVDKFDFLEAWRLFSAARAIKDDPTYRRDEGMARALSGDYARGLPLCEARLLLPGALRFKPPCPMWKGESLKDRKLMIIAEQGYGDVIQFARYQQFINEGELTWIVPQTLVRLMTGAVRGSVLAEGGALPPSDYFVPVMSLPTLLGVMRAEQTPIKVAPPATPKLPEGSKKLKIGLIWAGSRTNERDNERSIPLNMLAPLQNAVDADWYAPFIGEALNEAEGTPVMRLDNLITDFADTAALIKQLDCVISVDTADAHVAGTLGVKTFLLLARCPDWRWGATSDKTPWYASMTLVRQPKAGDWRSVVQRTAELLKRGL